MAVHPDICVDTKLKAEQSHTIASIMSGEDPNPLKKKVVESNKRINTMIVNSCEG